MLLVLSHTSMNNSGGAAAVLLVLACRGMPALPSELPASLARRQATESLHKSADWTTRGKVAEESPHEQQ